VNKEEAKLLRNKCDKNTIWEKIVIAVDLWCDCIDTTIIKPEQVARFRELLIGFLMVEHDKGYEIKLYPEMILGDCIHYTLLRNALDLSGIGIRHMNRRIKRMTIYPSGTLKIEYRERRKAEWI